MTAARSWWIIFCACALLALGVLAGVSAVVLSLEASERRAQSDAEYQESLRLAMWRMDSWLAPYLAREASRPHEDFRPFVPQPFAVSLGANRAPAEDVFVPSPLLVFHSELFSVHFQFDDEAGLTSPQLPGDDAFARAARAQIDPAIEARRERALDALRPILEREPIRARLARTDSIASKMQGEGPGAARLEALLDGGPDDVQRQKNQAEFEARTSCAVDTNAPPPPLASPAATVAVGPLVPLWVDGDDQDRDAREAVLLLVRRVQTSGSDALQGVVVDWSVMSARLLGQVRDLFPSASLEPVRAEDAPDAAGGRDMAMLPARLVTGSAPAPAVPRLTAARATLGLGWLAMIVALTSAGLTLQRSVEFGQRRERFVSAVTHELRTPLTTFRMYAGMLADGTVDDDERRASYLETLRSEASRLSSTVENVLTYARLERGSGPVARREDVTVGALLERAADSLRRRATETGASLEIVPGPAAVARVTTDVDAVQQILDNLVDNACKYAGGISPPSIRIDAVAGDGRVRIRVQDDGPGVPSGDARSIFAPFDRGRQAESGETTGVGLGLAISRGLARDLGGDLRLESPGNGGATFVLELPGLTLDLET